MRRGLLERGARGVAAVVALGVVACISDRPGAIEPPLELECSVPARLFGPDRAIVLIRDFEFRPDTLRIRAGTTVAWVSCEPAAREAHTVAAVDGSWASGLIPAEAVFERRFDAPGASDYLCGPHPHMRGTVLVE
jgi:hypothetical protein